MLRKKDLLLTFLCFRLLSAINFIPLKFDMTRGKVEFRPGFTRRLLWKITFFIAFAHAAYVTYQLIFSLLNPQYFSVFNFPIHFIHNFILVAGVFYSYLIFIRKKAHTIAIFNSLHNFDDDAENSNGKKRKLWSYSLQEVFMITFPFSLIYVLFQVFFGLFVYERNRIQLLFYAIPSYYRTDQIYYGGLIVEFILYNFAFGVCGFVVYSQITFFHKCLELADVKNFR